MTNLPSAADLEEYEAAKAAYFQARDRLRQAKAKIPKPEPGAARAASVAATKARNEEILRQFKNGVKGSDLATQYKLSRYQVYSIIETLKREHRVEASWKKFAREAELPESLLSGPL